MRARPGLPVIHSEVSSRSTTPVIPINGSDPVRRFRTDMAFTIALAGNTERKPGTLAVLGLNPNLSPVTLNNAFADR